MVRVAGSLQKSNDVMKLVNESMKLPELQKTMMEMSKGVLHVLQRSRMRLQQHGIVSVSVACKGRCHIILALLAGCVVYTDCTTSQ